MEEIEFDEASDDDDKSWKLRSAALKARKVCCVARTELLAILASCAGASSYGKRLSGQV